MANLSTIRIGTRKSALALVQAEEVKSRLIAACPGLAVELVHIVTTGDKIQDKPLYDVGGKALFTKEIEEALLDRRIDMAVHSMKDMQTVLPGGLAIGAMLEREDPRDMLVGEGLSSLEDLPSSAVVGTSSMRRAAQLLMRRPDLKTTALRGNVGTRLDRLKRGEVRAIILAVAGLKRLKLNDTPGVILPISEFLPAAAQGAIGIECRAGDMRACDLLKPLSHADTEMAVTCERAFLRVLDGSCRTPIGAYAEIRDKKIYFRGLLAKPDGSAAHTVEIHGGDAQALGDEAGRQILAKAGKKFY